jgi:K+-transporting ATPase ATPase C chain
MKMLFNSIRPAASLLAIMLLVTGIIYPLVITAIGQIFLSFAADGSLIVDKGKVKGSELIGQSFSDPKYFWGRPSATSPFPYNPEASSGSNYGQLNPDYLKGIKERVESLKAANPDSSAPIPIDLVTASGSGLDPHISISAAEYQIPRIAKARGLQESAVRKIVGEKIEKPTFGFMGEPRVNVLLLNLALDQARGGI